MIVILNEFTVFFIEGNQVSQLNYEVTIASYNQYTRLLLLTHAHPSYS